MLNFNSVKEPKDPKFIEDHKRKLKDSGALKMSIKDRLREIKMNEDRKLMMSSGIEEKLHGKSKELAKQRRLNRLRYKIDHK